MTQVGAQPDYYEILQVHPRAGPEIIKRAYRTLSREYHPDANSPEKRAWAEGMMSRLNEAYRVLSDPDARREYDALRQGQASAGIGATQADAVQSAVRHCHWHPQRARVSICSICGKSICAQCRRTSGMAVVCPDCETLGVATPSNEPLGQPGRRRAADDAVGRSGLAGALSALGRAGLAERIAFGVLLAAVAALVALLWVRGLIVLVALRFPGHLDAVTPLAIGLAILCVAAIGAAMTAARTFTRVGVTTALALAVGLAAAWTAHITVRPLEPMDAAAAEAKGPSAAVVLHSFALWQAGSSNRALRERLGLAYLDAFETSRRGGTASGHSVFGQGALVSLAHVSSPDVLRQRLEQRQSAGFLPLGPQKVLAVYLAASVAAGTRGDDTVVWTHAADILGSARDGTRALCLGLAYYRLSQAVRTMPGEALRRADDEYIGFMQRVVSSGREAPERPRGPLEQYFRNQAGPLLLDRVVGAADPAVVTALREDIERAQQDLGVRRPAQSPETTGTGPNGQTAPPAGQEATPPSQAAAPGAAPVAEETAGSSAPEEADGSSPAPRFIGNKSTHVYHRPDCRYLPELEQRVQLWSVEEARRYGFTPCQHCHPDRPPEAAASQDGGDPDG